MTQADLLMPLEPLIRVRSDTLRIRAYGESAGQPSPAHVDTEDQAEKEVWSSAGDNQLITANQTFGRRFKIKSYRTS